MRAFIGILLPGEVVEYVDNIKSELKKLPMRCKMVESENSHICLSFLGEIDEMGLERVKKSLDKIRESGSVTLSTGGMNFIPNERRVRVIMIDVKNTDGKLSELCNIIKDDIGGSMHPPHITLCRVKDMDDKENTISAIKRINVRNVMFQVKSIAVVKSELGRNGPIYEKLYTVDLSSN